MHSNIEQIKQPVRPDHPKKSFNFVRHASTFFTAFEEDLKAKLVAQQVNENEWLLYLENITGSKVDKILGRKYEFSEQLYLNELIPQKSQLYHQKIVNDILTQAEQSKYWSLLFSNILGRVIKIRNPYNDEYRFIKIFMKSLNEINQINERLEFEVNFIDQTEWHYLEHQSKVYSHDIKDLMRSGLQIIQNQNNSWLEKPKNEFILSSKEQLTEIYDQIQQKELDSFQKIRI